MERHTTRRIVGVAIALILSVFGILVAPNANAAVPCGISGTTKVKTKSIAGGVITATTYSDGDDTLCLILKKRSVGNTYKMTASVDYQPAKSFTNDFSRSTIGAGLSVAVWTQPPQTVVLRVVYRGKTYVAYSAHRK